MENNRSEFAAYFPKTIQSTLTKKDAVKYVEYLILSTQNKNMLVYFIFADKKLIGGIFIKDIDWKIPKGEIGYYLDKGFQGNGYGTLALQLLLEEAYLNWGFKKLFLRVHETNLASKSIALKNGFLLEGKLRNDFRDYYGNLLDVEYYGHVPN